MQLGRADPRYDTDLRAPLAAPRHTHTHVPNITCPSLCQGSWQVPAIRAKSKLPLETGIGSGGFFILVGNGLMFPLELPCCVVPAKVAC